MSRHEPLIKGAPAANAVALMCHLLGKEARERVPETLIHYFDEPILASKLYPEKEIWQLADCAAETIAEHYDEDPWTFIGRKSARYDLRNIYASMVVKGRPKVAVRRLPRLVSLYFAHGKSEIRQTSETSALFSYQRARPLPDRIGRMIGAYIQEYLATCGLDGAQVTYADPGETSGLAIWQCRWRV